MFIITIIIIISIIIIVINLLPLNYSSYDYSSGEVPRRLARRILPRAQLALGGPDEVGAPM